MTLQEAVQWLMDNNYLIAIKGKYRVTAKFNKEVTGQEVGVMKYGTTIMVQETAPSLSPALTGSGSLHLSTTDWSQAYLNFIKEAEVPAKGMGNGGIPYDLNKYSEPAMKAFRKIIESGVMYPVLVKSTMLYYRTHRSFAYKLTRYIEEGFWRSDYEALLTSAEDGTIVNHIQKEIDDNTEFNKFKIG